MVSNDCFSRGSVTRIAHANEAKLFSIIGPTVINVLQVKRSIFSLTMVRTYSTTNTLGRSR